jgi:hypothetical protein
MNHSLTNLSVAQLKKALSIKERIEALEKELTEILGSSETLPDSGTIRRRKISAAGRAKISAAATARWAKAKSGKTGSPSKEAAQPVKKKRKISAAGRRAIAEAATARWAKVRAEKAAAKK